VTADPAGGGSDPSTAVPTWFGPEDRPLFGWVHVPSRPGGQGVVLCPSLGLEGEASQLAYRSLARALADAGCTVLRFDYHGTGDSTGSLDDPDRLDEWMSDIDTGLAYLVDAGASRLHLVGARLGATLAARAASGRDDLASLTLWYPWTKGSQFVRYQRALRRMYAVDDDPSAGDGTIEIPGFVLGAELTAALRGLDTGRLALTPSTAVLVVDAADPDTGSVVRPEFGPDWSERRTGTGLDALFGVELMRAEVSEADLAVIGSFILACGTDGGTATITPALSVRARVEAPGGVPVTERAVSVGDAGLFGILAEPVATPGRTAAPDGDARSRRRTRVRTTAGEVPRFASALFLNAGSLHHVGPGRQWVELSRRWAAAGVRCLRMDIAGVGDSPATGPTGPLSSYPPGAEHDVAAGVRFLAPEDPGEVVLLGLCAGAYHALLAAPSTGVGGVAVLNPLRLPLPGDGSGTLGPLIEGAPVIGWPDEQQSRAPGPPRRRFLGTLRDRGVFRPLSRHLPDRVWWALHLGRGGTDPVRSLRRVVDGGAAVCVVLGPDEWPGIGRGRIHELRQVARGGVFAISFVPNLDHNFHVASGRRDALVVLDEWVLGAGADGSMVPAGVTTIS
jgi:dienelactone hydrolase